jgi:membrane protease YdiL (CAAX protease family)
VSAAGFWARVAAGCAGAVAILLWIDVPPPTHTGLPVGVPAALGALAGVVLFSLLSGDRPRFRRAIDPRSLLTRSVFLVVWAAVEEIAWRRLVLGEVAERNGLVAGLVASTAGFALLHRSGRGTHMLTGCCFGSVYLVTGALATPVVAHATYNLLIAGCLPASRAATRAA